MLHRSHLEVHAVAMSKRRLPIFLPLAACVLAGLLLGAFLFKHLSYPLLWDQEAVTAAYGARILEHGYPKVHGPKNAVYASELPPELGIDPSLDAFLGAPWGPYYIAALADAFARGAEDPWARTWRVRVPFALLGAAGLGVLLAFVLPLVAGDRSRRCWAAAAFLGLSGVSISLLLHLREVGSLAPTLFLLSVALLLLVRRYVHRDLSDASYGLGFGLTLFLLFGCDYAVSAGVAATALLLALWRGLRGSGDGTRLRCFAGDFAPLLLVGVVVAPLAGFFGLPAVVAASLESDGAELPGYGARLLDITLHLLRYEWLVPVLAARLALSLLRALSEGVPADGRLTKRLAAGDLLSLFVLVQWLGIACFPAFFERNAVPLGPVLSALLLLDSASLLEIQRARRGAMRGLGIAGLVGVALAIVVGLGLRVPEISGRFHEVRHRYRGPLDHVFAYVIEKYEDPQGLVVATLVEGSVFVYYFDPHVLVDSHRLTVDRDFLLQPQIIVPRPGGSSQTLGLLAVRASYDQEDLPVENLPRNNVPSLSSRDAGGIVHRFESADLSEGEGGGGLPLLELPR